MKMDALEKLRLTEIAFNAVGHLQEAASRVNRAQEGGCVRRRVNTDGHAIVGLDLILNTNGDLNLIEANGSNQAGSSFGAPDGDLARATHQVEAARERIAVAERGVILIAYATGTGAMPEIIARAALVRDAVNATHPCDLADTSHGLGHAMTVIVDTVEKIASYIGVRDGSLHYAGVPVVSAANPNLLPELVRRGVIARIGASYAINTSVFHDGQLVSLIHDKGAQQDVAFGTGIAPLRWRECNDIAECIIAVADMQALGLASVAKMNAGSGGAGVEFFGPRCGAGEVKAGLNRLVDAATGKYGDHIDKSIWPLRVFEFAQSTGYPLADGLHLWDLRVMGLIRPGSVDLTFCGIRVCPEPFISGHFEKNSVLSNTTGRRPDLSTTRSPLVEYGMPTAHLTAGGVNGQILDRIIDASAKWCEAAWARATEI